MTTPSQSAKKAAKTRAPRQEQINHKISLSLQEFYGTNSQVSKEQHIPLDSVSAESKDSKASLKAAKLKEAKLKEAKLKEALKALKAAKKTTEGLAKKVAKLQGPVSKKTLPANMKRGHGTQADLDKVNARHAKIAEDSFNQPKPVVYHTHR